MADTVIRPEAEGNAGLVNPWRCEVRLHFPLRSIFFRAHISNWRSCFRIDAFGLLIQA